MVYQLLDQLHFKRLQRNVDCEITLALLTHHAHQDMSPPQKIDEGPHP